MRIIELPEGAAPIRREGELLDLVASADFSDRRAILLRRGDLDASFFDLRTGLAGAVMQKLENYRIRAAFVLGPEGAPNARFEELVRECARCGRLRFFVDEVEARAWLEASAIAGT